VPVQISTLLAGKGDSVATITADMTVTTAVDELRAHGVGALVVSPDGEHIEGIVSERDIVRGLSGQLAALLAEPVRSIMTSTVFTCSPEDDVETLMAAMTERRIRHVPVVRDGILCGIISIGDVVKSRIDELEKERKELVEYINAR
jgi:CBS domain-containing protein